MKTHNGTVKSDQNEPGYVKYECAAWGVPDNTQGGIGWHVVYRPLCPEYKGHEYVTQAMMQAAEEHYAAVKAAALAPAVISEIIGTPTEGICPSCDTYCMGDCHGK